MHCRLENGQHGFCLCLRNVYVNCILSLLEVGSEVIAVDDLYGGTRRLFEKVATKKSGLNFKFVDYKNFF